MPLGPGRRIADNSPLYTTGCFNTAYDFIPPTHEMAKPSFSPSGRLLESIAGAKFTLVVTDGMIYFHPVVRPVDRVSSACARRGTMIEQGDT